MDIAVAWGDIVELKDGSLLFAYSPPGKGNHVGEVDRRRQNLERAGLHVPQP